MSLTNGKEECIYFFYALTCLSLLTPKEYNNIWHILLEQRSKTKKGTT